MNDHTDKQGSVRAYDLPPADTIAERIRNGEAASDVAAEFGLRIISLKRRLNKSGWDIAGERLHSKNMPPRVPTSIASPEQIAGPVDYTPPCAGMWWLFDSTNLLDHMEAKKICETCPLDMRRACAARLEEARAQQHASYGPQGTWAGELIGKTGRRLAKGDAA